MLIKSELKFVDVFNQITDGKHELAENKTAQNPVISITEYIMAGYCTQQTTIIIKENNQYTPFFLVSAGGGDFYFEKNILSHLNAKELLNSIIQFVASLPYPLEVKEGIAVDFASNVYKIIVKDFEGEKVVSEEDVNFEGNQKSSVKVKMIDSPFISLHDDDYVIEKLNEYIA